MNSTAAGMHMVKAGSRCIPLSQEKLKIITVNDCLRVQMVTIENND